MPPKPPSVPTEFHDDDAPDLSAPPWKGKFSKALLASAPLDGIKLDRDRDLGRDVQFVEDVGPIQTEEEYGNALREIEQYFREEPAHDTPEAARFNELSERIRLYEDEHHAVSPPDPDK